MKKIYILILIGTLVSFSSCGTLKKKEKQREIHYELITTLRDSLVITHEKKETITEKVVERLEDKKEKADNYKRTDKDGTVHEYYNYNTEIKTDEKTIENVKELKESLTVLETQNKTLNERLDKSEKETDKLRKQIDMFTLIMQVAGALIFIGCCVWLYKKYISKRLI